MVSSNCKHQFLQKNATRFNLRAPICENFPCNRPKVIGKTTCWVYSCKILVKGSIIHFTCMD